LLCIFEEGELRPDSVVNKFFTTASDGKRYNTSFYNLDEIMSVGYRVRSSAATQFRIWATERLREYIVKGFVLDDERLKNPKHPPRVNQTFAALFVASTFPTLRLSSNARFDCDRAKIHFRTAAGSELGHRSARLKGLLKCAKQPT
jgi:Virulence protein RhuM family